MSMKKRMVFLLVVSLIVSLVMVGCGNKPAENKDAAKAPAAEANYPNKPVELVIPFGAGGSHDLHARAIASSITQYLGQPMVVTLKPGGNGAVGVDYCAKAKPDGYTVLFSGSGPSTQLQFLMDVPYKKSDFIPIAKVNSSPAAIVVKKDSPFKTIKDLVDYGKAHPGELKYSSSGAFGATHIPVALFLKEAGVEATHVPFNGGGPALTAILGGHVDFGAPMTTQTIPFYKSGEVRVLATTEAERMPAMKDVPTLKESGYNVDYAMWRAVMVPKGTPDAVVTKLREAFKKLSEDASFKALITQMGERLDYADGPEFAKIWDAEESSQSAVLKELAAAEKAKAAAPAK